MPLEPVLLVAGQHETLKSRPGAKYRTMSWDQILDSVRKPSAVPKAAAPAIIPSSYIGHDGRNHNAQRKHGEFQYLCVDIDEGSPALEALTEAMRFILGVSAYIIYSSSSASAEVRKWRIIIPLGKGIPGHQYKKAAEAFFKQLGMSGIVCDVALARTGQLVYLPNVPPERREGGQTTGQPQFYQFVIAEGPLFDPSGLIPHDDDLQTEEHDSASDREDAEATGGSRSRGHQNFSGDRRRIPAIEDYNCRTPLDSALPKYGFQTDGIGNWRSPYQATGFATTILGDHWYSLSTNDVVMGQPAASGGTFGDAFDLLVHFEYGGDFNAALHGLEDSDPPPGDATGDEPGPETEPSGPLVIALGEQHGAALQAVTGFETIAVDAWSKVSTLRLEPGRQILLAFPDFARNSPAYHRGKGVLSGLRQRGFKVTALHPRSPALRDGSGFHELRAEEGDAWVQARIRLAMDKVERPSNEMTLEEGVAALEQAVVQFIDEALSGKLVTQAIKASVGVGKTHIVLRKVVAFLLALRELGDGRVVVLCVPHHKLSNQALKDFREAARGTGLTGNVWRGREAVDPRSPQGHRMCRNLDAVREVESVAGDVDGEVCAKCPFSEDCSYLMQSGLVGVDFWIVAHQSMYLNPPDQIMDAGIAALIIDEGFWQAGLAGFDEDLLVPLDALDLGAMPVPPDDDGFLSDMRQVLLRKVKDQPDGPTDIGCFRKSPLFWAFCRAAARKEWGRRIDEGTIVERAPNKSIRPMVALWEAIAEIPLEGDGSYRSGRLSLERVKATGVRQIRVRTRKPVNGHWCAPTLIIDATLEVDLVLPYFPKVDVVTEIAVRAPYQTIIQATDRAFGKSHFRGKDGEPDRKAMRVMRATALALDRQHQDGLLVVGNKSVIEALGLPPRIHEAWFNGLAGRNDWNEVEAAFIVGRPLPRPEDVEAMAGALTGRAVDPVGKWYPEADIDRPVRRGDVFELVADRGNWHPDSTVRTIMRSISSGQVAQAVGRLRGIRRTADNPVVIYVASDAVLAEPVDQIVDSAALLANDPTSLQLAEAGIAFHEPSAAAGVFPELWPSPFAAQKAFQRARSWTSPCKEPNTRQCPPPRLLRFRLAGAGMKEATAAFDPRDIAFPRDLIEAKLGPIAAIVRQWPMPGGLPPIQCQTIADLPRAEREPHIRHIDICRAHAWFCMSETDPILRQDGNAFVMTFMTDCIEGGWTAADLFGAADGKGPSGIIRQLRGRKVVEVTAEAVRLESGEALRREPLDEGS